MRLEDGTERGRSYGLRHFVAATRSLLVPGMGHVRVNDGAQLGRGQECRELGQEALERGAIQGCDRAVVPGHLDSQAIDVQLEVDGACCIPGLTDELAALDVRDRR